MEMFEIEIAPTSFNVSAVLAGCAPEEALEVAGEDGGIGFFWVFGRKYP